MTNENVTKKVNPKNVERIEVVYWPQDYYSTKRFITSNYDSLESAINAAVEFLNNYQVSHKKKYGDYARFELNYTVKRGELMLAYPSRAFGKYEDGVLTLDMNATLAAIKRFQGKLEEYPGESLVRDVDGPLLKLDNTPDHHGYFFCEPAESADFKVPCFVDFDVFDGTKHSRFCEEAWATNKEDAAKLAKEQVKDKIAYYYGPNATYTMTRVSSCYLPED